MDSGFVFEYDVVIKELDRKEYTPPTPPPGPELDPPGAVTFEGITIDGLASRVPLPEWQPPPPPEFRENLDILSVNGSFPLPSLKNTETVQHFSIPAAEIDGTIKELTINNDNTSREITVKNIRAFDPTARDGFIPSNPVNEASDAVLTLEGVKITRPENKIDDLIEE